MADGARTHDNRNHNPGLYQLSYSHRVSNYNRCRLARRLRRHDLNLEAVLQQAVIGLAFLRPEPRDLPGLGH